MREILADMRKDVANMHQSENEKLGKEVDLEQEGKLQEFLEKTNRNLQEIVVLATRRYVFVEVTMENVRRNEKLIEKFPFVTFGACSMGIGAVLLMCLL